jgi:hypothetical protein
VNHIGGTGGLVPGGGDPHDSDMQVRVALLEQIAKSTSDTLADIKSELRDIRGDMRAVRDKHDVDFRLTFGALIVVALGLAGMMAKGFGWL